MAELSREQLDMLKEKYGIIPNGMYYAFHCDKPVGLTLAWVGEIDIESKVFYDKHFTGRKFIIPHFEKTDKTYTLEEVINHGWLEPRRFSLMCIEEKKSVIEIMCRRRGPSATLDFITRKNFEYSDDEVIALFKTEDFSTEIEKMLNEVRPWEDEYDGNVVANGMYFSSKYDRFIWASRITISSEVRIFYDKHYSYKTYSTKDILSTDKRYTFEEVVEKGWITFDRFGLMGRTGESRALIEVMRKKKGPSATLNFITGDKDLGYTDEEVKAIFGTY